MNEHRRRALAALALTPLAASAPAARAAAQGDAKVLRVEFPIAETGFDPQFAYDTYSFAVIDSIFEAPYSYDYFARPAKLVPRTAAELPQITDDGRTYSVRLRPGIYFASDPAFGGKRRELVAEDYVYSIKRHLDPKVRSYWLYLFENHLLGLDDVLAGARKAGKLDYATPISGLEAVDRYTFRVRFKEPDYSFQHWLTTGQMAAVAR